MSHHHHKNGHPFSLGLLLILSACFAISLSRPANSNTEESEIEGVRPLSREVDQARKMWNVAKQAYKKMQKRLNKPLSRTKREEDYLPELANVTGRKYMLDLFRNLTNSTKPMRTETQANTIKSLSFVRRYPVPLCDGKFNFTLAAINSSEFILKTKLRLYLQRIHLSSPTYIVDIKVEQNGDLSEMSVMKEIVPSEDGYVEFEIASLLRLVSSKEKHAVFKVFIYTTIENLKSRLHLKCGNELKFVNSDVVEATMPTLIVYSYNPSVENIDYHKVAARAKLHASAPPTEADLNAATQVQRKRRSTIVGGCGVQPLHVFGSEIVPDLLGIDSRYSVQAPDSYNAGICGGRCVSNLPSGISSKHAPFIHVLLDINTFSTRTLLEFDQCCIPVKYRPLDVLIIGEGALSISIIQNMIIERCECIDIAV